MISLHDAGIMDFRHGSMKNHTEGMTSHIMGGSWVESMISHPVQICDVGLQGEVLHGASNDAGG